MWSTIKTFFKKKIYNFKVELLYFEGYKANLVLVKRAGAKQEQS